MLDPESRTLTPPTHPSPRPPILPSSHSPIPLRSPRALIAAGAALLLAAAVVWLTTPRPPSPPHGLPAVAWPEKTPYSPARVALGRLLFYDPRLSSDGKISCASCHDPKKAFTDGRRVSLGIHRQAGERNAPSIINAAYNAEQLWDGRAPTLEAQAKLALANPKEMTDDRDPETAYRNCVARVAAVRGYRRPFREAFGTEEPTTDRIAAAIAAFVRTVVSGNSPYDRYVAGDESALTPQQARGLEVFFNPGGCHGCHRGPNFTDGDYVMSGLERKRGYKDLGRFKVVPVERSYAAFKTPTLREVARTAPYMHDGSLKTLAEVVHHYNEALPDDDPHLDDRLTGKKGMTKQQEQDLVAFLHALNGEGWRHAGPPAHLPQ